MQRMYAISEEWREIAEGREAAMLLARKERDEARQWARRFWKLCNYAWHEARSEHSWAEKYYNGMLKEREEVNRLHAENAALANAGQDEYDRAERLRDAITRLEAKLADLRRQFPTRIEDSKPPQETTWIGKQRDDVITYSPNKTSTTDGKTK